MAARVRCPVARVGQTAGMIPIRTSRPGHGDQVFIGLSVRCRYRGGHHLLGSHGVHLWIRDDRIGHGRWRLTHSIPLSDVSSVDVRERREGGSEEKILLAEGLAQSLGPGAFGAGRGSRATPPKVVTDLTVRTKDGQDALWVVEDRGAEWVRGRLTGVLRDHGIPYSDDLPPGERPTTP